MGVPSIPLGRFTVFLAAGAPAAVLAILCNYTLVRYFLVPNSIAYLVCLLVQTAVNYEACRRWLFPDTTKGRSYWRHYLTFLKGSAFLRLLDWLLYLLWIGMGIPILVAQSVNIVLFSLLRFRFVNFAFRRQPQNEPAASFVAGGMKDIS